MSNENPTSTRVSAGALYDNTSAAGEYLFSVMMVMGSPRSERRWQGCSPQ